MPATDQRGQASQLSRHGLGPVDMALELKRYRHVAVAIPEFGVSRGITVSPRQQSPQPQQPDVAYHQTLVGWRGRQPVDGGLGFGHVTVGPAVEQCLHQNTRRWNAPPQQLSLAEQIVGGGAQERYRLIAVSTPSLLPRRVHLYER